MSNLTSKSDFYDWCNMHNTPAEIVEKADVYLGDAKVQIHSERDLVPYYTHIISSMGCSSDSQNIHLTKASYIDDEEKSYLMWDIQNAIEIARKAKKEKVDFTYDYFINHKNFVCSGTKPCVLKEIVERINNEPEIIKVHLYKDSYFNENFMKRWVIPMYFLGIHTARHTKERENFVELGKKNGYATFTLEDLDDDKFQFGKDSISHPVFMNMCNCIIEYKEMEKKYED